MSTPIAMFAALLALAACHEQTPLYPADAPAEIVQACALTERKCTACHERERYTVPRHTRERWREIVHKMRMFPSSSISPMEAEVILTCLSYRAAPTTLLDTNPRAATVDASMIAAP